MTIGGIASSSSTSTAASTASRPPSPLPSDAARDVGVPTIASPLPLVPLPVTEPGTPVPLPGEVPDDAPDDGELEPVVPVVDDEVGEPLLAGAGGFPWWGLPMAPTPMPGSHGPRPD